MSLDATVLSDFRADIGDETSPYAFTDLEVERLFARGGDAQGAKIIAINQLLANAVKFYNYTAGFTKVEQATVYDNLKDWLDRELKNNGNQALMLGLTVIPPKHKTVP